MENLLKINSKNLGYMDTVQEYQKISINDKIGNQLNTTELNIKRYDSLYIKPEFDIEDVWICLESHYEIYSTHSEKILISDENFMADLEIAYNSSHIGISIALSSDSIKNTIKYIQEIKLLLKYFSIDNTKMVHYTILQYDNSETLNETYYQDNVDVDFNPLAMPFINDIDKYIQDFLNSPAPLLILQGEPGTGKTTFVKYILSKMLEGNLINEELRAIYSFDESIIYISNFFKRLIYAKYDILILEDVNQIIHKNMDETGNLNPLNKFLSTTDGLISKKTKIIITTNISSKSQLYPALLRPGRCFDVVEFRKLQGVEIDDLCDSCAKDLDLQLESIHVSEFYAKCNNAQNQKLTDTKIGF